MAIFVDEKTKVLVQGITGREGRLRTKLMVEYGTRVVGGVTPGKGGDKVEDVPVFNTVREAVEYAEGIDLSVVFVPPKFIYDSAVEAIESGIKRLVLVPDKVPLQDVLRIAGLSQLRGSVFVGPNTLGVISPGKALVGMIGGRAENARKWFKPGPVGVISRSGGITSAISYYLTESGLGQSTSIHVGGDSVVGFDEEQAVLEFERDPETEAIVIFGEIGTTQEERVARLLSEGRVSKPVICLIGGKGAKEGVRFSHAGAIIEGGRGTRDSKVKALREAGATVVEDISEIPGAVKEALGR